MLRKEGENRKEKKIGGRKGKEGGNINQLELQRARTGQESYLRLT
jgi:hypothetical protein